MKLVSEVTVCWLPYQDQPFVHGVRDGKDVWLTRSGEWTEDESHGQIPLPYTQQAKQVAESRDARKLANPFVEDGFGNTWSKACPQCHHESMEVVRPGKIQCRLCG